MKSIFPLFLVIFFSSGLVSCQKKEGTAKVSCVDVEKFQSDAGIINVPQFKLGDIIILDTLTKNSQFVRSTNLDSSDISSSPSIDSVSMLTKSNFKINLTGDLTKAGADIQAEVKSIISNNTGFFLENSSRKNISDPLGVINRHNGFETIKSNFKNTKNTVCMFISAIVLADKFEFRIKKSSENTAKTNVLKIGNFSVNVDYDCQGSLQFNGKQGGVLYKPTFFALNDESDALIPKPSKINLSHYRLVNTFQLR